MGNIRNTRVIDSIRKCIPNNVVNHFWHFPKAVIANIRYGFPGRSLTIVGVTGTKGKTSVSHLIYHILLKTNKKVALLSTISAQIGSETIDTGLHTTNPDAFALQKLLKKISTSGCEYAVLEVTSMGLDQYRDLGIPFTLAVFTTIQMDHLDYHGSLQAYQRAKARLIDQSTRVLLNRADPAVHYLARYAKKIGKDVQYYSAIDDIDAQNQQAALAAAHLLGVPDNFAKSTIKSFPGIPGRLEVMQTDPFQVIIDFAHTPDSLKNATRSIRNRSKNLKRFIGVFGCAGERDHNRRKMGAVAAESFDLFIITAEDPRTEDLKKINAEIAAHAKAKGAKQVNLERFLKQQFVRESTVFTIIEDREKAIQTAIAMAKKGDVVGLFGKGHEKSLCFGKVEYPWSEHYVVIQALQKRSRKEI